MTSYAQMGVVEEGMVQKDHEIAAQTKRAQDIPGEILTMVGAGNGKKKLVQKAAKVSLATHGQSDLGSTGDPLLTEEYCLETKNEGLNKRGLAPQDCWAKKPSPSTSECKADSGKKICRCSQEDCQFDEELGNSKLAVCAHKVTYFQGGVFHNDRQDSTFPPGGNKHRRQGRQWIEGTGIEVYCFNMVQTKGWSPEKHIMRWGSDKPAQIDAYYSCWGNYRWDDNDQKCYLKKRYLGEKCWKNSDCVGYKESGFYATVCRDGVIKKCSPRTLKPRKFCGCDTSGRLACNSVQGSDCNNRACFTKQVPGKEYSKNWGYCDLTGPGWF